MSEDTAQHKGALYIVATPIGNTADISQRAIDELRLADVVLCEDLKPARRLMHMLSLQKELLPLNEHTTRAATEEAMDLLQEGKRLALISDTGTPLLADPGSQLVARCIQEGVPVHPVPGPSSVLAALVISGFPLERFLFAGFLPRDKEARRREAKALAARMETIVLLEAPYRLPQLLDDLEHGFSPAREAVVAMDLTLPTERAIRGTLLELREHFARKPFKGEFVVVLRGSGRPPQRSHSERQAHAGEGRSGIYRKARRD